MTDWNDQTAEWYAENYGEYPTNRAALDGLEFNPGMVIVDVGCGTGSALRSASEHFPGGKLIGIDPVDRMIEIATEKTIDHPAVDRIRYQKGSAEALPLDDNFSDLVFAFDSIAHWKDRNKGLNEILRILKNSGLFVVVKDLGVPDAVKQLVVLENELQLSGFEIHENREIVIDKVRFVRIICGRATI